MSDPSVPLSLQLTHAPYWIAAALMVLLARRIRRDLEALAAALESL